jgi:GNAT superfamily N-acetyltransferase
MIESIDLSNSSEALGVLKEAFASHPVLPPGMPAPCRARFLELMLKTFGGTGKAWLHGIRRDGVLACVALSLDAQLEPKGPAMLGFFFRMFRILGWRTTRQFLGAFSKRPKYADRYLELMLLGTLPAFQGQGLGRTMLGFLYGFAEAQGYRGVILGVARETPAYQFYLKEGFVVDSELEMNRVPLCNMRRENKTGTVPFTA